MNQPQFSDQFTLSKTAEELGEKALRLGLIPSFVVHHFPDNQQFYIPNENESEPLTPEEAYLHLKKMTEEAEGS